MPQNIVVVIVTIKTKKRGNRNEKSSQIFSYVLVGTYGYASPEYVMIGKFWIFFYFT